MSTEVSGTSVTVVMPTYNDERWIGQALDSIMTQSVPPAAIVVVDDGSTDTTPSVVEGAAASFEQAEIAFHFHRMEHNVGSELARNAGAAFVTTDWIATCDADDWWFPNKLERQLAFLASFSDPRRDDPRDLVVLGTDGVNVNMAGKPVGPLRPGLTSVEAFEQRQAAGTYFMIPHCSALYRRDIFEKVGGYRLDYLGAEDLDLYWRMSRYGLVLSLPEPLIAYRKRPGSMQHSLFWQQQVQKQRLVSNIKRDRQSLPPLDTDAFMNVMKQWPMKRRLAWRRRALSRYLYRKGTTEFANEQRLRGLLHLAAATTLQPSLAAHGMGLFVARNRIEPRRGTA